MFPIVFWFGYDLHKRYAINSFWSKFMPSHLGTLHQPPAERCLSICSSKAVVYLLSTSCFLGGALLGQRDTIATADLFYGSVGVARVPEHFLMHFRLYIQMIGLHTKLRVLETLPLRLPFVGNVMCTFRHADLHNCLLEKYSWLLNVSQS